MNLQTATAANDFHGPASFSAETRAFQRPAAPQASKDSRTFDTQAFLLSTGIADTVEYRQTEVIFSQGDPCETVMYLQNGDVKLTVLSKVGKEAIVAMLRPGDFLGEGALTGRPTRTTTAIAVTESRILVIEKLEMLRLLHTEQAFSGRFIAHMLARATRIEEDLVDQLFNSAEKRLARTLLMLARYGKQAKPRALPATITQEMLAEMIGTTRSRVNVFMNKFKKQGLIGYVDNGLAVNDSLLNVVLQD